MTSRQIVGSEPINDIRGKSSLLREESEPATSPISTLKPRRSPCAARSRTTAGNREDAGEANGDPGICGTHQSAPGGDGRSGTPDRLADIRRQTERRFPRSVNARYDEAGFLYEEKQARLEPYWATVADNWDRTMSAGHDLRRLFSWQSPDGSRWAYLDLRRATDRSWWVQHLVANGGGAGSLATMLAATARSFADPWLIGCERSGFGPPILSRTACWAAAPTPWAATAAEAPVVSPGSALRPTSRAGQRVEVRSPSPIGRSAPTGRRKPAPHVIPPSPRYPMIHSSTRSTAATKQSVYSGTGDLAATDRAGRLCGAALAYRAPLGLNYSFLENRCDVLLSDEEPEEASGTARALVAAAADTYRDFTPGFIPVTLYVVEHTNSAIRPDRPRRRKPADLRSRCRSRRPSPPSTTGRDL